MGIIDIFEFGEKSKNVIEFYLNQLRLINFLKHKLENIPKYYQEGIRY